MPYKSNSTQAPRVYKKRVQPDFSSLLLTQDVSLNIPAVIEEVVPDVVEEVVPDIVEEVVPDIVEDFFPKYIQLVPNTVEEVVNLIIPPPPIFSEDGTKILNYNTNRYVKVGGAIDLKFNLSKTD